MKRLLKSPAVQWLLALIISLWLRVVYLTSRKTKIIAPAAEAAMRGEEPGIFCFWHGRMILHPFIKPPGRAMRVLISHHRDGALITAVMRFFDIGTVRGSSRKGGDQALRELFTVLANGDNISITPDGPKGPAYIAQHGAAYAAQKTGLKVIPLCFSSSRARRFKSWDKFLLPRLFGHVVFVVGQPLSFAPEEPIETASERLTQAMNAVMQEADQKAGRI
ncbi:MAG: lysophospholipid acyltransferase family protein [Alphaproteobacteria bacterium]|jgi:lysophospholipid acyltransferase (LPLAT)-like uncharacterized protein|nr:lysophospholipid acyltransferase family protein [Rickettsiales bacterium]